MAELRQILFVCTGNTCRSPMGEAWLAAHLQKIGMEEQFIVHSCGVYAAYGMKASQGAIDRLAKESIDLSQHRSRPIDKEMVDKASLIFCMSHSHSKYILDSWPKALNKIIILNIDDPIGFGYSVYDACYQGIVKALNAHMGRILEG